METETGRNAMKIKINVPNFIKAFRTGFKSRLEHGKNDPQAASGKVPPQPDPFLDLALTMGIACGGTAMGIEDLCRLLKTSPEAYAKFQESYETNALDWQDENDLFGSNAKQVSGGLEHLTSCPPATIDRIVCGLIEGTRLMTVGKNGISIETLRAPRDATPVTKEELMAIPEEDRPWLTAEMMKCDIPDSSGPALAWFWKQYLDEKDPVKKKAFYDHFRQGLDILDLDGLTYEMIGTNPCSMGHWLPQVARAAAKTGFFKIPETKIILVPITLLQLTRQPYKALNGATLKIVDGYCHEVFGLDDTKSYFIKTGTFSSKFDFRNCLVTGEKEVRELGEYLLFIHYQALMAASPLTKPCTYGMSTTNEWVVREYVAPSEEPPRIYKGLPLRTEYRCFVDFDKKTVMAVAPYWDPKTMKRKFARACRENPHDLHDMGTYAAYEDVLMGRFKAYRTTVADKCLELVRNTEGLSGQWSVDVMQDGDDFWLIDMAPAHMSALREYVPEGMLEVPEENWLPEIK